MTLAIHQRPSPNWNLRPEGITPSLVIIHADASASVAGSLAWVQRRESKVSYHYLIGRTGHIYQCVTPEHRAWHAGVSEWHGAQDCNDFSIGVCLSNDQEGERFTDLAVTAAAKLCASLIRKFPGITVERITTHEAVALPRGRKRDPGELFPMAEFLRQIEEQLTERCVARG